MRLLTYNIHGCVGRSGRPDPEAVLAVIEETDADVVALQEVHDEDAADRSFLRALERRLDYPSVIYDSTMRKAEARYGNVLMCRLPLKAQERIDLGHDGREPRAAIRVRLDRQGREIEITATHLGLAPGERRAQLRQLAESGARPLPPGSVRILMGDLNEWFPFGRAARTLRRRFGPVRYVPTFPARLPLFALDRIHVLPATVRVVKRVPAGEAARKASDHLPLVADLDLDGD